MEELEKYAEGERLPGSPGAISTHRKFDEQVPPHQANTLTEEDETFCSPDRSNLDSRNRGSSIVKQSQLEAAADFYTPGNSFDQRNMSKLIKKSNVTEHI